MVVGRGTSRSLGLTVSTTNCIGLRKEPYKFRYSLIYDYLVEYDAEYGGGEVEPDLLGIENAVAYGVAAALDDCDEDESPLYAVELVSRHEVFQDGFCAPVDVTNECKVIRGYTEIRLDSVSEIVELEAYSAITSVIHEPMFLNQFLSMSFDKIKFLRVVDEVLTSNEPEETDHSPPLVAVAAAILSFALASIFLAGLWRKNRRSKDRVKKQVEAPSSSNKRFLLGSAPRKYYELDEEAGGGSNFKMVEWLKQDSNSITEQLENPSVTWSISDITSESGSILSNLSRTTSKLERIEEEDNESQTEDEFDLTDTYDDDDDHLIDPIPLECLYDLPSSPRHHVDQWDVDLDALEEGTEPEGCQYLEDTSSEEECADIDSDCERAMNSANDDNAGFHRSTDTANKDADELEDTPSLSSLLNTSEDTVETSNETRAVLQNGARDLENDVEAEKVRKWLVELVKDLRKGQSQKLLTYSDDD